jgi:PAS domain S-box-containing protein
MLDGIGGVFQRLAHRVGGPRVLALPLLRAFAVFTALTWLALAPAAYRGSVGLVILGFCLYSVAVETSLWRWPAATLRLNFWVLLIDLAFALTLIARSGGAGSGLYLALLLIPALQAYYNGILRGTVVAALSAVAYTVVVSPTMAHADAANVAVRAVVIVGTAISAGILADLEERERLVVASLSTAARERERFVASVVERLQEGVVALDADGRVLAWNRALERRYGVAADEVVGKRFFDFFPNVAGAPWTERLRRLLRGEIEAFTAEAVDHVTLRRGRVVVNLKGSVLREGARVAGAVLLVEDITERVAFERSARQGEKLAALGTLAAGLAHELNNPIGIISARAELMRLEAESAPLPGAVREDLAVIHRHAQRVARIAQGLLSFARQSPGERELVDLNRVVDQTLLLVEKTIVKEGVTLKRALAPDLPRIWGDANALQQVIMNLLTNARDATEAGDEVAIETSWDAVDGTVRLAVSDSGPGIPPEVLPKIFDPFFTTKPTGTGLGLALSYGIVREHEGTLDVRSQPGEGTTFVVAFRPARAGART